MVVLAKLEQAVWSWPLLLLILGCGIFLTVRLRAYPFRRLPQALRLIFEKPEQDGISPFAALCTSLSATVGTGNIVGAAAAVVLGGAGALFWMNVSAVLCMSVKYAECLLAVRFREGKNGGPFVYLRHIPGGKVLSALFAVFGAIAGLFGVGTFVQVNSVTSGTDDFLFHCAPALFCEVTVFGVKHGLLTVLLCAGMAVLAAVILCGGIERISRASSVLVPLMAGLYLLLCVWILLANRAVLPDVLRRTVSEAFCPKAVGGGLLGVMQAGISRGIFSNEAGLGTAPIAAAAGGSNNAVHQGLVGMTANLFDTVLVCSLTGLCVLCTGADRLGLLGTAVTMRAFARGLPFAPAVSQGAVLLCLSLFAFTTVIGWSFYGVRCLGALTHENPLARKLYLCLYVAAVFFAPYLHTETVWTAANILNGLMAAPNLLGLLLLSGEVTKETFYGTDLSGRTTHRGGQAAARTVHRRAGRHAGACKAGAWR